MEIIDWKAAILCFMFIGGGLLLRHWSRQFYSPSLFLSKQPLEPAAAGWGRGFWSRLPYYCLWGALSFFLIAFLNPKMEVSRDSAMKPEIRPYPTEGIAIFLALDQSGSMGEEVEPGVSKLDLLKQLTSDFVAGDPRYNLPGRSRDLIGLVGFARGANVLAPLTLDHRAIEKKLKGLRVVQDRAEQGTAIGYAIYKTASMIFATRELSQELTEEGEKAYDIKSSIIVLVTDGFQDPNPLDKGKRLRNIGILEAAEYAKSVGVKLYLINVDPRVSMEQFSHYRNLMERAASLTGGRFYPVTASRSLQEVYSDIDQLETSQVPRTETAPPKALFYFYPYLVFAGLLLLTLFALQETLLLRRAP